MRESLIEKDGVAYAIARGWLVYKWSSPGRVGIHDRLFFKNSVTFSIEYKATGKKATPKQTKEAFKLKRAQIPSRCCDSVESSRSFIDTMTEVADMQDPIFDMIMLCADLTSFGEEE